MVLAQIGFKAPSVELTNLNNLWFQISGTMCNLKCSHCFLSCNPNTKTKNFLPLEKIRNFLEESKKFNIKDIYLTGGEPLLHPDLNNIIRMCLKRTNVTIITNGTLINEKKARFLRQIEQDHDYEIIFRISLDHYREEKNDEIRGKGSFKKIIGGIENLLKHGFNPIISAVNVFNEDEESFKKGFFELFSKINFDAEEINLKIISPLKLGEYSNNFGKYDENDIVMAKDKEITDFQQFDCASSRVITDNGVYSCPALVNDPRGKVGKTLSDSSTKVFLETNTCFTCKENKKALFNNSWTE